MSFPQSGDSIDGHCHIIAGIHRSSAPRTQPIMLKTIPHVTSCPLADFIYTPFNKMNYSISVSPLDPQFDSQQTGMEVSLPKSSNSNRSPYQSLCMYNIHRTSDEKSISHGASIFHMSHLLPQIEVDHSDNIFGPLFGVEYQSNNHTYIRAISQYEYVCAFGFDANMNMELSKPTNLSALQFGVPSRTSHWLISSIHEELDAICSANTDFLDSNQPHVAPAATTQTFLSGAIGSRMLDHEQWTKAYANNPCTAMLLRMVSNLSLIDDKSNMSIIHYVYRQPICKLLIIVEDDILYMKEPLASNDSFAKLQIVPASLLLLSVQTQLAPT